MDVGGSQGGVKADINVTPLVDVMLVLLIIMILVAPMLDSGVQVNLPQADNTVDKPQTQEQTIVNISANKIMYLGNTQITEGELGSKVNDALSDKTEKVVLIRADEEVEYGTVMAAMDQLRQAGVEDIGLLTRPDQTGGGTPAGGQ
jgi:biopolymer transport protein ExbD